MCNVIYFAFEGGNGAHICSSKNNVAYCGKKTKDNVVFNKSTLKAFLKHLIQNCCFIVGNSFLKQKTRIPTGNNQAQFWANFSLYTYENDYMPEPISNDKVNAHLFRAINVLLISFLDTLNDGDVFNDVYKDIYALELQVKVEHSGIHTTFLNLDVFAKDKVLAYKLFDKRDAFPCLSFTCLTLIITSPSQYFILFLLVNLLE